jgi:hypothetical protein
MAARTARRLGTLAANPSTGLALDRDRFFAHVRLDPFGGSLTPGQVDGLNAILDAWEKRPDFTDLRWLAYLLATAKWETARRHLDEDREMLRESADPDLRELARAEIPGLEVDVERLDEELKQLLLPRDPLDQKECFLGQLEAKQRGQQETMDYDEDYIRALEYGMPPTAGEGIGIDRLAMLFTDAASIRDVILFPLLKPQSK